MKNLRAEVRQSLLDSNSGFLGVLDSLIFTAFNITDEELIYISQNATEEDLEVFVLGLGSFENPATFSQIRQALEIRTKYLQKHKTTK